MIYLIRHGQTAWNLEKRLQGGLNSPLTPAGRQQADDIARLLMADPPATLISSPLGRAVESAAIITAALRIDRSVDDRLHELRFGDAEGRTKEEIESIWPGLHGERERDKWRFRWPGGESYADVSERIADFMDALAIRAKDGIDGPSQHLAIVGHETSNMVLLGRFLALPPDLVIKIGQPNDTVYRIDGASLQHARHGAMAPTWRSGVLEKRTFEVLEPPASTAEPASA